MDLLNARRAEFQGRMLRDIRESVREKHKSILVQLQTGGGKTHLEAMIAAGAVAKGYPVLTVGPWRKIVKQIHATMDLYKLDPSFLMAGCKHDSQALVQVACEKTLKNRVARAKAARRCGALLDVLGPIEQSGAFPPAKIVMIDEAHRGKNFWLRELYPDALIFGFTATPIDGDGNGLGEQYTDLILGPPTREMVEAGLLLPAHVIYPKGLEFKNKKNPHLIGEVLDTWREHALGKRTVIFAKSVRHSEELCEKFNAAGIPAEHIDSTISDEPEEDGLSPRDKIYARLERGEIKVLCNFGILVEGVDIPAIECIMLCRPDRKMVMNLVTYIQARGRGARPYTDPVTGPQTHFILIDMTKTIEKLGMNPDEDWPWSLEDKAKDTIERMIMRAKKNDDEEGDFEKLAACVCGASYRPAPKCPVCGRDTPKRNGCLEEIPAKLVEWGSEVNASLAWDEAKALRFYRELMGAFSKKEDWLARKMAREIAERELPPSMHKSDKELRLLGASPPSNEVKKIVDNDRKQRWLLKNKGYDPAKVRGRQKKV